MHTHEQVENPRTNPGTAKDKLLTTLEQLLAIEVTGLDESLDQASTLVAEALNCDKVDTFLFDPSINSLVAHGVSNTPMGIKQQRLGLATLPIANGGRSARVYLTGEPYLCGHVDEDPDELPGIKGPLGVRSAVAVTLDMYGERRGVFQATDGAPNKFSEHDLHFIQAVSRWIAMVTHRAELVETTTEDAARQASRSTAEELIEVLAHDINNYLTPLGGWLDLLVQRASQEQNNTYLVPAQAAYRGVTRLRRLVNDLLDVRRLQYGLMALSLQPVDLVELVHEAAGTMQTSRHRIILEIQDTGNRTAFYVQADPARIGQVLDNLISNALKFSPEGMPVTVTLSTQIGDDGQWAALTVSDRGPGIPEERQSTLFTRYSAGPESTGLGLGLYLAHSIAEAHGGSLTVKSAPGAGAEFTLRLPLIDPRAVGA
jgi:two-component system, OmpR family, sensor kinase